MREIVSRKSQKKLVLAAKITVKCRRREACFRRYCAQRQFTSTVASRNMTGGFQDFGTRLRFGDMRLARLSP